MNIHQLWVADGLPNHPNRLLHSIDSITIHTTGNRNLTATAEAHARFQFNGGGNRQASWHYTVDQDEIWQSFRDNQMCWHTGTSKGNETSIGIEICVNSWEGFIEACNKSAWLTASLMEKYKLSLSQVLQHFDWSNKNCPRELRSGEWGINWEGFITMVQGHYKQNYNQNQPSDWAVKAWSWGVSNNITDGTAPQGRPSREQVIQLLFNYDKHAKKAPLR